MTNSAKPWPRLSSTGARHDHHPRPLDSPHRRLRRLVQGVDLNRANDAEIDAIRSTVFDRGVAFIHGQQMTPEQQIAFAKRLAPIVVNRYFPKTERYPEIAKVEKTPSSRPTSAAAGTPTTATTSRRPWARCCWPSRRRPPAATPCSPTCMPPMTPSPTA
uniref:TauD/TfdA family dioxygenase n=1 Tax=Phenylobacterium glaciei TaxID=2803784 RepID=A0A974P4N4_9CAUL|nr:TauD/TfdA family dioxygenase [Phenylobacterium glaciei]